MKSKKILITAGPTHEAIDPVRFIGNYSSGKMGYAIADICAQMGAEVCLVSGPVNEIPLHKNVKVVDVLTAEEMYNSSCKEFINADVAIFAAAVADFRPEILLKSKVKRGKDNMQIILKPTKDIAAELGKQKKENQITVGFALETDNELKNAEGKRIRKNFDFIVLNSLNDKGAGFGTDTNKITIVDKNNNIDKFELKSKKEVALDIVNKIMTFL